MPRQSTGSVTPDELLEALSSLISRNRSSAPTTEQQSAIDHYDDLQAFLGRAEGGRVPFTYVECGYHTLDAIDLAATVSGDSGAPDSGGPASDPGA